MAKPTMNLRDIQQALSDQDGRLRAAYRAFVDASPHPSVALPVGALERLRDACEAQLPSGSASSPHIGIRC